MGGFDLFVAIPPFRGSSLACRRLPPGALGKENPTQKPVSVMHVTIHGGHKGTYRPKMSGFIKSQMIRSLKKVLIGIL